MQVRHTGSAEYGRYIKMLVCGQPGSGKTRISSTAPKPFFASAEGGLMSIADRNTPYVEIKHSNDLLELKKALELPRDQRASVLGTDVQTIVVDTIDEIAKILMRERIEESKKDQMAIADWGWLGDQMRGIIRAFRGLDMNVVMTCHLKSTEDSETGRTFFKPSIQGAVGDEIAGYVDLALLLEARTVARIVDGESKRVPVRQLIAAPDPNFPWIKDRSGKLPPEIEVNLDDDFERIHSLVFGGAELPTGNVMDVQQPGDVQPEAKVAVKAKSEPKKEPDLLDALPKKVEGMTPAEKMATPGPWECEGCGTAVTNADQRDLSVVKKRQVLCAKCIAK